MNEAPSSCNGCNSSCCRAGQAIELTSREAERLMDAGTDLRQMDPSEFEGHKPARHHTFWKMNSDCGNLVETSGGETFCGAYDTRPGVCRAVKVGGFICQLARQRQGTVTPVTIGMRSRDAS